MNMDTYLEFAGNHALLVSALLISFFFLVYTEIRRQAQGITSVEPQAAVKLINADALVLDLRSAESFARGHIVNAKNVAPDELSTNQDKYTQNKSRPILAVCDAGVASSRAVDGLRKAGVENVYGLKGGIAAWTQANLPLVTARKTKKGKS
jgi:rhodanese-related sulfurtransferase